MFGSTVSSIQMLVTNIVNDIYNYMYAFAINLIVSKD